MAKEYIHTKYFEDKHIIVIKEMIYFIFLFFTLDIISSIIERTMKLFIPAFEITQSLFLATFSLFVFFLLVIDKIRIGFLENLWTGMNKRKKRYKSFIVWFEGMDRYSFTKSEVERYLKKQSVVNKNVQ